MWLARSATGSRSNRAPRFVVFLQADTCPSNVSDEPRRAASVHAPTAPSRCWAAANSQPLSTIDLAQVAVKGAERSVPCFPSDLHHEAIGESDLRLLPKQRDGGGDRLGVLDGQVLVAQEHLDGRRDRPGTTIVDGAKHPGCLRDCEVRHPCPIGNEGLSDGYLLHVISRHEADQH